MNTPGAADLDVSKAERGRVLSGQFFDQLYTGIEIPVIGEAYRWESLEQPLLEHKDLPKALEGKELYVADDWWSWADPNGRCYKLSVIVRKPFVLLEQFEEFEVTFAEGAALHWELVRNGGFDSVVYTPHEYGRGYRQAALLEPLKQILSWEPYYPDQDVLAMKRQSLNAKWSQLMGLQPGCPYSPQQLKEAETRAMAHRYMYYVESDPVITDREYDLLDAAILPWLPPESPLHKPGSSLEQSYTEEHRRCARLLQVGKWLHEPDFVYIRR